MNGGVMSEAEAQAAMAQAMADATARQDFYGARPGAGVPAGTTGSDPRPVVLPEDRAVTGVHGGNDAA